MQSAACLPANRQPTCVPPLRGQLPPSLPIKSTAAHSSTGLPWPSRPAGHPTTTDSIQRRLAAPKHRATKKGGRGARSCFELVGGALCRAKTVERLHEQVGGQGGCTSASKAGVEGAWVACPPAPRCPWGPKQRSRLHPKKPRWRSAASTGRPCCGRGRGFDTQRGHGICLASSEGCLPPLHANRRCVPYGTAKTRKPALLKHCAGLAASRRQAPASA